MSKYIFITLIFTFSTSFADNLRKGQSLAVKVDQNYFVKQNVKRATIISPDQLKQAKLNPQPNLKMRRISGATALANSKKTTDANLVLEAYRKFLMAKNARTIASIRNKKVEHNSAKPAPDIANTAPVPTVKHVTNSVATTVMTPVSKDSTTAAAAPATPLIEKTIANQPTPVVKKSKWDFLWKLIAKIKSLFNKQKNTKEQYIAKPAKTAKSQQRQISSTEKDKKN